MHIEAAEEMQNVRRLDRVIGEGNRTFFLEEH